jgi:uncharacterized protein (TIGR02145 family)
MQNIRYNQTDKIRPVMKKLFIILNLLVLAGFTSLFPQTTVKDRDGNIYMTIRIGNQIWISENLKTTKFNDGKPIDLVTGDKAWGSLSKPGFCYFDNNPENKDIYGALYNWYAVNTKKLCPEGWHVPADEEWRTMVNLLGGNNVAGDKLKESGYEHWKNHLLAPTNDYDFTALPGGTRLYSGIFPEFGHSYAVWWTSTEYSSLSAHNWGLHESSSRVFNGHDSKQSGFSVRCIMDKK